jgi:hypothetical protein
MKPQRIVDANAYRRGWVYGWYARQSGEETLYGGALELSLLTPVVQRAFISGYLDCSQGTMFAPFREAALGHER